MSEDAETPSEAECADTTAFVAVPRFLAGAVAAGLAEAADAEGQARFQGQLLQPEVIAEDYAATSDEAKAYRALLAKAGARADVVTAAVASRIDQAAAIEALGGKGKPKDKPQLVVAGAFLLSSRGQSERQHVAVEVLDLATTERAPGRVASLEALAGAESSPLKLSAAQSKTVAPALEALKVAGEAAGERFAAEVQALVLAQAAARRQQVEGYFAGLEQEAAEEEKRLAYHLYYFDRAEKLKAKKKADRGERDKLIALENRFHRFEVTIEARCLAVLSLPTWVSGKRRVCGLTGELL